jgi:DNA-binding MarR family transcriptional regulator
MTDHLMKQLRFISEASNTFMSQNNQRLSGQQRVLAVLNLEDGLVQNYLAEVLDLRPSSLAELLKKMESSGDIQRKEDAADKRIKRIFLTATGRKKSRKITGTKRSRQQSNVFCWVNRGRTNRICPSA